MSEQEQRQIFCENLNRIIKERELTQSDIANAIGVSPQTFNTWVQGKAIPRMGKLQALADYFRIQKSELIEKYRPAPTPSEDEKIHALLQDLKDNPAIGMLLSASRDLSEDDIKALADMAKRLRSTYRE